MVSLELPTITDDQIFNANNLTMDPLLEHHTENQQWNLLSTSLEIYFLWLLSMMIIYALTFALLLYIRSYKRNQEATTKGKRDENVPTSGNTVVSINDKDLYPILNLAGDKTSAYLKPLDVGKISKPNDQDLGEAKKTNHGKEILTDTKGEEL